MASHTTTTPLVDPVLREHLRSTKAREVLPAQWDLVSVRTTDNVGTAFRKMAEKNLAAVPVFDQSANKFKGFLSFSDIVHQIVHFFVAKAKLAHPDLAHDAHQLLAKSTFHQTDAENIHHKVFSHPLGDLINVSGMNSWKTISETASLQEVIDTLVSEKLLRIALVDAAGHVTAILSESVIVRHLACHTDKFGSFHETTLGTLKGAPLIESSDYEEKAIACFSKLDSHKASHLPLSSHGNPQGNLSVKDIRSAIDTFDRLVQPVGEFIAHVRQQNMKAVHPYLHANTTDTLGKTISRFAATGVHNMYLTDMPRDDLDKTSVYPPVAVISLTTLLTPFASHC